MRSSSFACTSREDFARSGEGGRELGEDDAATRSSVIAPSGVADVRATTFAKLPIKEFTEKGSVRSVPHFAKTGQSRFLHIFFFASCNARTRPGKICVYAN